MGSGRMDETKILRVDLRFAKKEEFLERFLPDVGAGGFLWNSPPREIGDILEFNISVIGYPRKFLMPAMVVWKSSSPPDKPDLPPGVGIEFDPTHSKTLKQLLKFITTSDEDIALKAKDDRAAARLRVTLDCEYLYDGRLQRKKVTNISNVGLFISTDKLLPEGTQLIFFVYDEHLLRPMALEGRVIWVSENAENPGFGIQLLFDSRKHKIEIQRYLNSLGDLLDEE